jgi:hypothetical protein
MNQVIGQILRMTGLLIELIGVWAVFRFSGDRKATQIALPGGRSAPIGWLIVILGFAIWLTGRIWFSVSTPPRRRREKIDDDNAWSGQVGQDLANPGLTADAADEPQGFDQIKP